MAEDESMDAARSFFADGSKQQGLKVMGNFIRGLTLQRDTCRRSTTGTVVTRFVLNVCFGLPKQSADSVDSRPLWYF